MSDTPVPQPEPSEEYPVHAHEDPDEIEEAEERTSVPDDFDPEREDDVEED
jgi:hypothetical protein